MCLRLSKCYLIDVILTDHHKLPSDLPKVHSLIHPETTPTNSSYRALAGVGITYVLASSLAKRIKSKAALSNYAESLYFDMKRFNVRVSVVSPGFIKTPMTDKNKFPMPMIKSPEFAAEKMFIGLTKKNAFEIHFPIAFTIIMKLLKIMPNWLYFLLVKKGMKTIKY